MRRPELGGLGVSWDWHKWWTYDGISGPQFWGLINPEWSLCTNGRRQSPVNLDPATLLYDPNLRQLHVDKHRPSPAQPISVPQPPFNSPPPSCLTPSLPVSRAPHLPPVGRTTTRIRTNLSGPRH
ncbi:hypothetical protein O3P69_013654 [Scylla paramamosain]|uniref:Alpha-carbonic anhydrase domain-containing protein n=1 Tax=Scylla paramamosain TaxID=85552 RepID=A0AAW0SPW6_SCYPA